MRQRACVATRFATDLRVLAERLLASVAGLVVDTPHHVPRVMVLDASARRAPEYLDLALRARRPVAPKLPKP